MTRRRQRVALAFAQACDKVMRETLAEDRVPIDETAAASQRLDDCPDCVEHGKEPDGCLRCDGTGTICGVCGEAPEACRCPVGN